MNRLITSTTLLVGAVLWLVPFATVSADEARPAPGTETTSSIPEPFIPVPREVAPPSRDPAHLYYAEGVGLLSAGDLPGARTKLREALRLRPDLVQARFSLGTALYLSGDVDSAIEAYRTVIRLQPDLAHAHLHLGIALMVKHDWPGAQSALEKAVSLNPDSVPAHYNLGLVRYRLGDRRGAMEAYRETLRLRPDHADAHYHLGLSLKSDKQEAEATREFLAASRGGVPQAQYFVGVAYASGLGVERDLPSAIAWWFLAADQEVPQAKEALVQLRKMTLTTGKRSAGEARVVQDAFAAFRRSLWQQVSDLKGRAPDESVGVALLQAGRWQEAVPVLLHEASALSEEAQAQLEALYANGLDGQLPRHDGRILAYFKEAADEGLPYPRLILARIYARGLGVPADPHKALGLLKGNPREDAQALAKELSAVTKGRPRKSS
jgi:tetratricopeptide (TPR) repeat protein